MSNKEEETALPQRQQRPTALHAYNTCLRFHGLFNTSKKKLGTPTLKRQQFFMQGQPVDL